MNKNNLSIGMIVLGALVSGSIIGTALAQTQTTLQPQEQKMPGDIQYPIPELGNCTSKENCKTFCDNTKNIGVCLRFAEERKMLSAEELALAKKFKDSGMVGPGGCNGKTQCDAYCSVSTHLEECMNFAIEAGIMDAQKQEESKKVLAAIKRGVKMPACNGQADCDKYCSVSTHLEECMNFAIEAGIMDAQKQEESKKVLAAIKRGVKMPACNGKEECDTYCSSSEHMEECINFGLESGMMPEQEKDKAQKILAALKQGIKPPACRGESECQKYCSEDAHVQECVKFGEATGTIKAEDAAMMIKTGGKGPGGCKSKEECTAFCENSANSEICFNFGKENGLISADDLKKMEEGNQKMKDSFNNMPAEVLSCLTSSLGVDTIEKLKSGNAMPGQKVGEQMKICFEQYVPQGKMPNEQSQSMQGGLDNMPGDMKECIKNQIGEDGLAKIQSGSVSDLSLMEKAKNCFEKYGQKDQPVNNFQPGSGVVNPGNQQMPQQAGPGGCKGPEECASYCREHSDECKNFGGQGMGQGGNLIPGNQMNVSPEIEKQIRTQLEDAVKSGQVPAGFENGNLDLNDLKDLQELKGQMPFQGGPVPVQSGQMPPQGVMPPQGTMQPPVQMMQPGVQGGPIPFQGMPQ